MSTPSYYDPYFYFLTNVIKLKGKVLGQLSFFGSIAMLIGIVFYKYYLKDIREISEEKIVPNVIITLKLQSLR